MDDTTRSEIIQRLDALWKIQPQPLTSGLPLVGTAKELANSLARWYIQAIVEQQNVFNAAVVQALQALSANDDRRHNELVAQIHMLHGQFSGMHQQIGVLLRRMEQIERRLEALDRHLSDADDADTALAAALVDIQQQMADHKEV